MKPGIKKQDTDDGYISNSSEDNDGDHHIEDDNKPKQYAYPKLPQKRKRLHKFRPEEFNKSVTVMIAWIGYILSWFPFHVGAYTWTYSPTSIGESGLLFVAWTSYLGLLVKCIVYVVHNRSFRGFFLEALGRKKAQDKDNPVSEPIETNEEIPDDEKEEYEI